MDKILSLSPKKKALLIAVLTLFVAVPFAYGAVQILHEPHVFDVTDTEALQVRKDNDGGDVFNVDSTNNEVEVFGDLAVGGGNLNFTVESSITSSAGDITVSASDDVWLSASGNDIFTTDKLTVSQVVAGATNSLRLANTQAAADGVGMYMSFVGDAGWSTMAYIGSVWTAANNDDSNLYFTTRDDDVLSTKLKMLADGELEFQQETTLSTTAGDFILDPNGGDVGITGDLTVDGIKISSDLDEDIQIMEVEVTGNPSLWWDESENEFEFDRGMDITGNVYISGDLTVDGTIYGELGEFFYLTEGLSDTYVAKLETRILALEAKVAELEAQLAKILQYLD